MPHWRHLYASDVRAPENSFEHGRQKIAARQTGGRYYLFTSSLSCSFLLIFLYRGNSPDPAPAELEKGTVSKANISADQKSWHFESMRNRQCASPSHYIVVELRCLVNVPESKGLMINCTSCIKSKVTWWDKNLTYFSFLW